MNAVYSGPKVTFPKYAARAGGTSTADLAEADRANIAYLFNPNPNFNEVDTAAAERAVASGTTGSGFALNSKMKLRDSEKINRAQIGHQMLDPYLAREHSSASQAASEAAELNRIAAQGEQAKEMLKLQQSGQMQLQSEAQRAQLEQMVLQGTQAMDRLKFSDTGDTNRVNLNNQSALERTVIGGAFDLASKYGGTGSGGGGGAPAGLQPDGRTRYGTMYDNVGTAPVGAAANSANIGTSMSGFPGPGAPPVNPSPVKPLAVSSGGTRPIQQSPLVSSAIKTVDRILQSYGLS